MSKPDAIGLLLAMVDEAFDAPAWHGPTLRGSLRGVTARRSAWRPNRGRHNIRDIVIHAAYWKHAVRRRLLGGAPWAFPLGGGNWIDAESKRSWKDDVGLLVDEHRQLRAVIASYPAGALDRIVDKKGQTAAFSIRGVAAHDVYHAGQIQLIKKLSAR
jgi:DinB superfamily